MPSGDNRSRDWFEEWFGRDYLEAYPHRDSSEAAADIDAICRLLPLERLQPILDLACGSGRHSLELARRGYSVLGVDLSRPLLDVARGRAAKQGLDVSFERADMRRLPYAARFGCVLNLFTSFGYFESDEDNRLALANIRRALRPGGRFLIDYLNKDFVLRKLVAVDYPGDEGNGKVATQRRYFDPVSNRLIKTILVRDGDGHKVFRESVRLFSRDEMVTLAAQAGLEVTSILGGLDGRALDQAAGRLVIIGRRPDANR